jgi:hypothetical protein
MTALRLSLTLVAMFVGSLGAAFGLYAAACWQSSASSSGDAWDSVALQKRTAMMRRNEGLSHANAKGEAASPPLVIEPAAA